LNSFNACNTAVARCQSKQLRHLITSVTDCLLTRIFAVIYRFQMRLFIRLYNKATANTNKVTRELLKAVQVQLSVFKTALQRAALRAVQAEGQVLMPITMVVTRWGSMYAAMERVMQLRSYINAYYAALPAGTSSNSIRSKRFTLWGPLAEVVAMLKPFAKMQTLLQRRDLGMAEAWHIILHPYLQLCNLQQEVHSYTDPPTKTMRVEDFSQIAAAFRARMVNEYVERFYVGMQHFPDCLLMAIYLDPLHGIAVLRCLDVLRAAVANLKQTAAPASLLVNAEHLILAELQRLLPRACDGSSVAAQASKRQRTNGFSPLVIPAALLQAAPEAASSTQQRDTAAEQLLLYKQAAEALANSYDSSDDIERFEPLLWWQKRCSEGGFAQLSDIAKRMLAMRPTSVESERNFSHAGLVRTAKRSRLRVDTTEMMMFIKLNCDLITDPDNIPKLRNAANLYPEVFQCDGHERETVLADEVDVLADDVDGDGDADDATSDDLGNVEFDAEAEEDDVGDVAFGSIDMGDDTMA
jgi:hAT family C-terminal dimerisation region